MSIKRSGGSGRWLLLAAVVGMIEIQAAQAEDPKPPAEQDAVVPVPHNAPAVHGAPVPGHHHGTPAPHHPGAVVPNAGYGPGAAYAYGAGWGGLSAYGPYGPGPGGYGGPYPYALPYYRSGYITPTGWFGYNYTYPYPGYYEYPYYYGALRAGPLGFGWYNSAGR